MRTLILVALLGLAVLPGVASAVAWEVADPGSCVGLPGVAEVCEGDQVGWTCYEVYLAGGDPSTVCFW